MTQLLDDDILLLGCAVVKMAESSEELHDCDSDTDSESAEPAPKKKTKFTEGFKFFRGMEEKVAICVSCTCMAAPAVLDATYVQRV